MSALECSLVLMSAQELHSKLSKQNLTENDVPIVFSNISAKISPNNIKMDIFEIYIERAVEKCPR